MNVNDHLPAVRPLDVSVLHDEAGQPTFALRDMLRIAPHGISVSMPAYFLITQLDGTSSLADIRTAFERQFGQPVSAEQVLRLVKALDEGLMLLSDRFESAYAERRSAYLAAPARDNCDRWPPADVVRTEIEAILAQGAPSPSAATLRGIIAPHLDYARGAPCYADAYATLFAAEPADRYVILGTNHFGRSTGVVATAKDFRTPLGTVPTDRALIERIERRLCESIRVHELDHDVEHSVELQVHFLQVGLAGRDFRILPILCPDPSCGPEIDEGPDLPEFIAALRAELGRADGRTLLIAGADLSHVGQRFGDAEVTTPEFLEAVDRSDRALLRRLERNEEEGFVGQVRATGNPTRVCSVGCVYTLLSTLSGEPCRVLRYHQAIDLEDETHVTCAAAAVG